MREKGKSKVGVDQELEADVGNGKAWVMAGTSGDTGICPEAAPSPRHGGSLLIKQKLTPIPPEHLLAAWGHALLRPTLAI